MKVKTQKLKLFLKLFPFFFFLFTFLGCDAFVRKFTRKPKGEPRRVEQVVEPQVYMPPAAREQYRDFLLYWQSEQDELINALVTKSSQKKQLSCAKGALKNLNNLRPLLTAAKQKKLDIFIADLEALKSAIEKDPYSNNAANNARSAEHIRRLLPKEFSLNKVSADIVSGGEVK
ncbi:MAG: hypothetical protein Q8O22_04995 [Candidatus Omnitrophota bacterium]|nr:hypothetical protein [Candidatus Omnitrophota bacterium]